MSWDAIGAIGEIVGACGAVEIGEDGNPKAGSSKTLPLVQVKAVRFKRVAVAEGLGSSVPE